LLTQTTVAGYLRERGFPDIGGEPAVELGGGVSNVVLAARSGGRELVVKQALPHLRVAEPWAAKRERALTEAAALSLARGLTPDSVPRVLDVDEERCALVIERAPAVWRPWKEHLLEGHADVEVAGRLGELLAVWHRATWDDAETAERFGDYEAFEQLRIDPYHRTVAQRRPELAGAITEQVAAMRANRRCLVHGDYSPKNVLVGGSGLWVIDFEVAHYGDPLFDVAFMLSHLVLKAIHRPGGREAYEHCAGAFLGRYELPLDPRVLGQLGCLVAARVDGKSPVEYLEEPGRERARVLAARLLLEPPPSPEAVWSLL
jgi:aminoglycoside phosphotransferase (APT) family kinase protein